MKVTIDFPDNLFITKEQLDNILKDYVKKNTNPDPDPEPEPIEDCKEGPDVKEVKVITSKQLEVTFHGKDVFELKYTLTKGDSLVQEGIFKPTNNKPVINLDKNLTEGTYSLKLEGTLCKGEDTKTFEYKTSTPPPDPGNGGGGTKNTLETTIYYNK